MITDQEAQIIAAEWHGGISSSLYSFCSTGTIVEGVFEEIDTCLKCCWPDEIENLVALDMYCKASGIRGPVTTWNQVWEEYTWIHG